MEQVFPSLGHRCASTALPPASDVLSMAQTFLVDSSGCMPRLRLVEPGGQRFHACHWYTSLGPRLAHGSVAEVLAALVGLLPRSGCCPSLGDLSGHIWGRGESRLYHHVPTCIAGYVNLAVCLLVPVDPGETQNPVDLLFRCRGRGNPVLFN